MLPKSQSTSRYEIIAKIAAGGMATVYLGALKGPYGFEQLVAIKKLHAHLLDEPAVRESLLIEARSASRIRHANVVDVRDIEVCEDSVQLVMAYIEGASLSTLLLNASRNKKKVPPGIAIRIILDICAGLHAAHELTNDNGKPLGLVHRDVSPQNVLVGIDGITRITDFGVARDDSSHRINTHTGSLKGKFAYMAPEYIRGARPDRRVDVFALAVVLWESLSGRRLFRGKHDAETISRVTNMKVPRIGYLVPDLGDDIDNVLDIALSKNPDARFNTAEDLRLALETVAEKTNVIATAAEVGQYVRENAREDLERLEQLRYAAAQSNKTIENDVPSFGARFESAPEITLVAPPSAAAVAAAPPVVAPVEDAQQARMNYRKQVDSMLVADLTETLANTPKPSRMEAPETLRTPSTRHFEQPAQSVAVVSPPPRSSEVSNPVSSPVSSSGTRIGPLGTAVMAPMPHIRELVLRQASEAPRASSPFCSTQHSAHNTKDSQIAAILTTLPVPMRRESIAVLPFHQDKHEQPKGSRRRWWVAACFVFLISGVGVALVAGPVAQATTSSSQAKK